MEPTCPECGSVDLQLELADLDDVIACNECGAMIPVADLLDLALD